MTGIFNKTDRSKANLLICMGDLFFESIKNFDFFESALFELTKR